MSYRVLVSSDRVAVMTNRVPVALARVAVVASRVPVTLNYVTVPADRVQVSTDRVLVASDRVPVSTDCVLVSSNRVAVSSNRVAVSIDRVLIASACVAVPRNGAPAWPARAAGLSKPGTRNGTPARGNFARPERSAQHRHAGPCAWPGAFQRHDKGVHMAGVDVAASGGHKRAMNSDINMIPFIDLLMCTIAFLLITAVWTTSASIRADAQVPGGDIGETPPVERVLHVGVTERDFTLVWRHGRTVLSETHVPRPEAALGAGGAARYPELAKAIEKEWTQYREHFDAADRHFDMAVVHTDDHTPFSDVVAVLDAVGATRREIRAPGGEVKQVPAFNPTFATH